MAAITEVQLENAAADAQALEDIVNGAPDRENPGHPAGTVTTRLGRLVRTISNILSSIIVQETTATASAALAVGAKNLALQYANANTDADIPGAAPGERGARFFSNLAGQNATIVSLKPYGLPAAAVADAKGRFAARIGAGRTKFGSTSISDLNVKTIAGRPATSVIAFFGNGGIQRNDIGLLLNISYGQSLSVGTNSSNDPADSSLLTPIDYYHNFMFKGGVFYPAKNNDVSELIAYAAIRQPNGGPGETIHGGYNAMLAQLFNAFGVPPLDNPMSTISAAPGIGESPIESFMEGTGVFDRMLLGVQAAMDLRAGRKVIVAPIKWMQVETQASPGGGDITTANYIAKLLQLAEQCDRRIRAITGQIEPVGLLTYQQRVGDSSAKFSEAARLSKLIQIAGPIWDLKVAGLSGSQFDSVHMSNKGYFLYGARCAVADFCTIYLKRPWRPLQISRNARGLVRCTVESADRLRVKWDVPFDGEIQLTQGNPLINLNGQIGTGALKQNGLFISSAGGIDIPLREAVPVARDEMLFIGTNIVAVGNSLNVASPLLTRNFQAGCNLTDRMGDVIKVDDLGGAPLNNPAIGESWTMTSTELGL